MLSMLDWLCAKLMEAEITAKAGANKNEHSGERSGYRSGSCKLFKESLSSEIKKGLDEKGVCVVPIPAEANMGEKLGMKACQQYALKEFAENIILLDTGPAKLMTPYFPLEKLRMIPGFEKARYEDPLQAAMETQCATSNLQTSTMPCRHKELLTTFFAQGSGQAQ